MTLPFASQRDTSASIFTCLWVDNAAVWFSVLFKLLLPITRTRRAFRSRSPASFLHVQSDYHQRPTIALWNTGRCKIWPVEMEGDIDLL